MRRTLAAALLMLAGAATAAAQDVIAIQGGRVYTVSGAVLERGTVLISAGKIAAVGATVEVPPGATVIDAAGSSVYPGLIDGLTTLGLTEIGSVPGSVDTTEVGEVNPQVRAWVAVHPHSELIPVARANGVTAALAAPAGGLVSGQSALIRLAGSTPDALTVKTPAAMHVVYPSGAPRVRHHEDVRRAGAEDLRGAPEGEEGEPGEGPAPAHATSSRTPRRTARRWTSPLARRRSTWPWKRWRRWLSARSRW